ncbi:hypothetical protein JVT61DRAFT_7535 [Boletus reticuloceps]|uniref:Uncharacterized protein n=1 Tax=Boletus reticuloceps TaxID=495285 RepID=A0A8I3A6Y1_9AGAM|nr:hypothetical protein JVT61DRAFT_7535 [Boletus reticuloceps]
MPGPCCAYELVGGVFCKTQPTVRKTRGGFRGALIGWPGFVTTGHGVQGDDQEELETTHVLGSRTLCATWLPGTHNPVRTAVRDDLGIPTRDFAMDPSQDLIVLFKGGEDVGLPMAVVYPGVLELHIRTMSTNQTHPEARVPVLCTPVLYPVTSVFVQIVDDVVGIMHCVDPSRPRITIWNWKTGRLVVDRASSNLPLGTWDFSFIHSRALFVTTVSGNGSLELFTFTCDRADADANADSSSVPSQPQPESTSPLVHVATLYFPPVRPSVRVLSIGTHTGPFVAGCPADASFTSANEDRIYVLTVQYVHSPTVDGPRTRPRVCVFVHQRMLERYLGMGECANQKGVAMASSNVGSDAGRGAGRSAAIEVHWSEWGQTARMLPHVGMFQWLRYVHGQRVVMLLPTFNSSKSTLQVLDFNLRRVFDDDNTNTSNEHLHEDGHENGDADPSLSKTILERVDYPTRIIMPSIFVDPVESGLPYLEARREVEGNYSGVMIDDERLIALKYPAFLTGDMKEVDVYTM